MATINKDLYVLNSQLRFVDNLTGPAYGDDSLPALAAGNTLALRIFYLDPFDGAARATPIHRYAGASTVVRLRAQGNNTIYADGTSGSEIVPATGVTLTSMASGAAHAIKAIRVDFNSSPATGTFTIRLIAPSSSADVPGGLDYVYAAGGTTAAIPFNATAGEIEAALNALPFYRYRSNDGGGKLGGTYDINVSSPVSSFKIRNRNATGFEIHFGDLRQQGGQGWNTQAYTIADPTFDLANIQWPYGWNVSVPLDGNGNTFADLFLVANAPAYFEVLLTPSGGSAAVAAQRQITSEGSEGVPPPPEEPPPPPPPPGSIDGVIFDGSHDDAFPMGDVSIGHGIADDEFSLIYRQRYRQRRVLWYPFGIGVKNCPFNQHAILVDETTLEDTSIAGICEWTRVWALKPNARQRTGSYSKTYKSKAYILENGQPVPSTFSIASRTAIIRADFQYAYFNIITEAMPIPGIPDIAVVHNGPFHYYQHYDGFVDTNWGYVLIGVDTRPYMGPIWERVLVYG